MGIELSSFVLSYAATFSLGPALASLIRSQSENPPPLLSLLCILLIYFLSRRLLKGVFRPILTTHAHEGEMPRVRSRFSWLSGAALGVVRGAIIVAGIALIGWCVARLQNAGLMRAIPLAEESFIVHEAGGLAGVVMYRFKRDAGPTTRLLLELSLDPKEEKIDELMKSAVMERIKTSDEVRVFARNVEVKRLIKQKRTAELVTHPAFLRILSLVIRELGNEKRAVLPAYASLSDQ